MRRHRNHRAARHEHIVDPQPFRRRRARQAARHGRAQAQDLVEDVVEVGDVLDGRVRPGRRARWQGGVEDALELGQDARVRREQVQGVGEDGRGRVAAGDDDQPRVFVEGDLARGRGAVAGVARFEEPGDQVVRVLGRVEGLYGVVRWGQSKERPPTCRKGVCTFSLRATWFLQ